MAIKADQSSMLQLLVFGEFITIILLPWLKGYSRCMEHAINVATGYVVKYLIPKKHSKATSTSDDEQSSEEELDDEADDSYVGGEDALRKALDLVKQVRTFPFTH